jgi:hypothetical protein
MRAAALALLAVAAGCPPTPIPKATTTAAAANDTVAIPLTVELPPTSTGVGTPGSVVESLWDVCLDDGGRVARVAPASGDAADSAIATALRRWSWFVVAAAPRPCWRQRVLLGVPATSRIVRQAGGDVRAHALARPATPPSRALMTLYAGQTVDGQYKVCVGDEGQVQSVRPVRGIAGGDDWASAIVRATAWEIVVGTLAAAPYCFAASVRLESTVAPAKGTPSPPPPSARPKQPGVSIVLTR